MFTAAEASGEKQGRPWLGSVVSRCSYGHAHTHQYHGNYNNSSSST